VVATEVKDLAEETAQATSDITAKISAIQEMTAGTADAIARITDIITQIDDGQSAERVSTAAGEIQSLIGEFHY
jgi:methyl-accepting chemotaxis protein